MNSATRHSTITIVGPRPDKNSLLRGLKDLIRQKNRALKRVRLTIHPINKLTANRLTNDVRRELVSHRADRWSKLPQEIDDGNDMDSLWRIRKLIKKRKISNSSFTVQII